METPGANVEVRSERNIWFIECHEPDCGWWYVRPSKKRALKWQSVHIAMHRSKETK